jgi:hypothetical protein
MASSRLLCAAVASVLLALALAAAPTHASASRGALLSSHRISRLSTADAKHLLHALTLPGAHVRYSVDAYRLRYATVGVGGRPTSATGLVALPRTARRLPTVSYAHGTMAARADVPSASSGFPTVAPDYLGLGGGDGRHPYMHAASEATASLDMLRAARTFAARRHRPLRNDTLVTGFSQGAQAAMAFGQVLQADGDPRFRLRALAPMSGPYAIQQAEFPAALAGRLDSLATNYYLSYGMRSWQPIYHVFNHESDVWQPGWGPRVARLFDGRHDDVAIMKVLPRKLAQLFTPAFLARIARPDGGLLTALRENDTTCDWKPAVPVRLYAARGDHQVAFQNSTLCAARLRDQGVAAPVLDMGAVDHFPSTTKAAPRVLRWFTSLR